MKRIGEGRGIVSRKGELDEGIDELKRRIGVNSVRLRRDVIRIKGLDRVIGRRVISGIIGVGEESKMWVCEEDWKILGVGEELEEEKKGMNERIVEMERKEKELRMVEEEIEKLRKGRIKIGEERGKIIVERCERIIMELGDEEIVDGRIERIGKKIEIREIVVDKGKIIVINVFKEVIRNELRMMEVEEEGKEKVLKEERGKVREGRSRGENEEEVLRKKIGKGEGKEGSKKEEEKIDEIEKDMVGRGKEMIRIERIVGKIKEEFIKIDEERIVDELKGGLREIF